MRVSIATLSCIFWIFYAPLAFSLDAEKQIPDEYESTGGYIGAYSNGGVAAIGGLTAVRANPAMLSQQKEYSVSAGYHWPTGGREFFQAGVIDSKTSAVSAGVSYTGFNDEYDYSPEDSLDLQYDSPLIKRGAVAASQQIGPLSAGIGATYVEAHPLLGTDRFGDSRVKGFGINFGLAGSVMSQWRWGLSAENLSNRKIRDYAPTIYRAGTSVTLFGGYVAANFDLRQRQRIAVFEAKESELTSETEDELMKNPERMSIVSFSARVFDLLRILGSYGKSMTDDRTTFGGGLALINNKFSLSYVSSRPYVSNTATHNAVNLSFAISM